MIRVALNIRKASDGIGLQAAGLGEEAVDLFAHPFVVIGQGDKFEGQASIDGFAEVFPDRLDRLGRRHFGFIARQHLGGPALERFQEQVVHRLELVVDEALPDPRHFGYPPRRDGRIALLPHDLFGRVEDRIGNLGVARPQPPFRRQVCSPVWFQPAVA